MPSPPRRLGNSRTDAPSLKEEYQQHQSRLRDADESSDPESIRKAGPIFCAINSVDRRIGAIGAKVRALRESMEPVMMPEGITAKVADGDGEASSGPDTIPLMARRISDQDHELSLIEYALDDMINRLNL